MFPKIETIDDIYPAIRGRDEFKVNDKGDYLAVDYYVNFDDTFPRTNTDDSELNNLYRIRRECRGIKFYKNGQIAARPYHKFFNLNERPEVNANLFSWNNFIIFDKLDGSLIHPLKINGEWFLCTKAGKTDIADQALEFIKGKNNFFEYFEACLANGSTPCFEWCSRKQRIVVDYPRDMLILTGVRHNVTGQYDNYEYMCHVAEKYSIPVVKTWGNTVESIDQFLNEATKREGEEGYVIRWNNSGDMVKVKNEWYCQLHRTKSLMAQEKDVWLLVLNSKVDDAKPFMTDDEREQIDNFSTKLHEAIRLLEDKIYWDVTAWVDNNGDSQKKFAIEFVQKNVDPRLHGLYYAQKAGKEIGPAIIEWIKNNCSSGPKLERIRDLFGIRWNGLELYTGD